MPTDNRIFTYTEKERAHYSTLNFIDSGRTYVLAVGVDSQESISALVPQIQAVYDDSSRAPDGQFTVRQMGESAVCVVFTRNCAADADAIGICSSQLKPSSAARQLAREFEGVEGDAPFIAALHSALIAFADKHAHL
ncbi:hypothetical protein [Pseudomonas serbica]|uniref:hypothetical protein n=1 Tax=Pseudomonas serbica TaxID=2965074 RepID=UPI00237C1B17|nr:hypothetical protein [Pseudomonas serbica]